MILNINVKKERFILQLMIQLIQKVMIVKMLKLEHIKKLKSCGKNILLELR